MGNHSILTLFELDSTARTIMLRCVISGFVIKYNLLAQYHYISRNDDG